MRRPDIDAVRVFGTVAVFVYHVMMYFNPWPWHVKNGITSPAFVPFNLTLITWIMPAFFLISGFAARTSLARRGAGAFMKERLARLGIPLLFGIFVLSPHQVYTERVTTGEFAGTFAAFLPHDFRGWYGITPGGNFAWMGLHLWYLLAVLVFSLATLPASLSASTRRFTGWLAQRFHAAGPSGVLLFPPVLVVCLEGLLDALGWDAGHAGWPFGVYLFHYLSGFVLLADERFRANVRGAGRAAWLGVAATLIPTALVPEPAAFGTAFVAWHLARACHGWWWTVGLLYLADRHLGRPSRIMDYCNEAVLPFYILHQPVIVALGFLLRSVPIPVAVKFPLLLALAFACTVALYHGAVRPVDWLRFLCGMRPRDPVRVSRAYPGWSRNGGTPGRMDRW